MYPSDRFIYKIPKDIQHRFWVFWNTWGRVLCRERRVSSSLRRRILERYRLIPRELNQIVRRQLGWSCLYEAVRNDAYFKSHPEQARAVFTDWIGRTKLVRTTSIGLVFHLACVKIFEKRFHSIDPAELLHRINRWFQMLGQLEPSHAPHQPRQVSRAVVRRVREMSTRNPRLSCRVVAQRIRAKGMRVSHATVQRIMRRPNSFLIRCQLCSPENKARRDAERRVWRQARREATALYAQYWQAPKPAVRCSR